MSREQMRVMGVSAHYGPRSAGGSSGNVKTEGTDNELRLDLTAQAISDGNLTNALLPAGSYTKSAELQVTEAFDTDSLVLDFGTEGSEATNGVTITTANLGSTGVVDLSTALSGTWNEDTPLAAATLAQLVITSGTVDDLTVGKARLVVRYRQV